jgi:hypothetical protein
MRYFRWVLNLDPAPMTADELLAAAEQDLRAGTVPSNPDRARAWLYLSHLLMRKSQTADGKLAALRAYEADPYLKDANLVLWRLFQTSLDLEDGAEASKWCREGYARFAGDPVFTECQIELYALEGQKPDIAKAGDCSRKTSAHTRRARANTGDAVETPRRHGAGTGRIERQRRCGGPARPHG